jgi:hypothetical protein
MSRHGTFSVTLLHPHGSSEISSLGTSTVTAPAAMASCNGVQRLPQMVILALTIFVATTIRALNAGMLDEMGLKNAAIAFPRNCCEDEGKGVCMVATEMRKRIITHPMIWVAGDEMKGTEVGGGGQCDISNGVDSRVWEVVKGMWRSWILI